MRLEKGTKKTRTRFFSIKVTEFKSRADHKLNLFQVVHPWFNPSAVPLHSHLVCLLSVGILNLLSLFQCFVSLAQKSPRRKRSIKHKLRLCGAQAGMM